MENLHTTPSHWNNDNHLSITLGLPQVICFFKYSFLDELFSFGLCFKWELTHYNLN